jgi:hypothetical protein
MHYKIAAIALQRKVPVTSVGRSVEPVKARLPFRIDAMEIKPVNPAGNARIKRVTAERPCCP